MKDIHQQTFQDCSHKIVGLPYGAFDCWDVARIFYLNVFGESLESYSYQDPNNEELVSTLIDSVKHKYFQVQEPRFGDLMLLRIHGLGAHVGVYLDHKSFLHTTEKTGSIIDKTHNWKNKILGYYRLCQD